jgi:hypothetical protein
LLALLDSWRVGLSDPPPSHAHAPAQQQRHAPSATRAARPLLSLMPRSIIIYTRLRRAASAPHAQVSSPS